MSNMWRGLNISKGPSSVVMNFIHLKIKKAARKSLKSWSYEGKTEKNNKILQYRKTERRRDRETREEVKEVGKREKGGGNEGGGREKCSSCTLSFKGAKNFIPWKSPLSFFLSFFLWKILQAPCSAQLLFTHTSTFTQSYI